VTIHSDFDRATDPVVAALASVGKAGVNARLQATLGGDAVVAALGYPAPLEILSAAELPALAVYVRRERIERTSARALANQDRVATVWIDYVAPATPLAKIATRWPLLRAVWWELVQSLSTPDAAGLATLKAAGVIVVDVDGATVDFDVAPGAGGGTPFPFFRAVLPVTHRGAADLSALADLVDMDVRYLLDGLRASEQPIVRDIVGGPPLTDSEDT
jgi:hypothetical protein